MDIFAIIFYRLIAIQLTQILYYSNLLYSETEKTTSNYNYVIVIAKRCQHTEIKCQHKEMTFFRKISKIKVIL